MKWNQWVAIVLGVWLLTSPWVLGFSALNLATWNNVLVGALLVLLLFWDLVSREP